MDVYEKSNKLQLLKNTYIKAKHNFLLQSPFLQGLTYVYRGLESKIYLSPEYLLKIWEFCQKILKIVKNLNFAIWKKVPLNFVGPLQLK